MADGKIKIDRGHFMIGRSLLRKLAVEHPNEILMSARGKDLRGDEVVRYLDSLPIGRNWVSDCPNPKAGGACGCFPD